MSGIIAVAGALLRSSDRHAALPLLLDLSYANQLLEFLEVPERFRAR